MTNTNTNTNRAFWLPGEDGDETAFADENAGGEQEPICLLSDALRLGLMAKGATVADAFFLVENFILSQSIRQEESRLDIARRLLSGELVGLNAVAEEKTQIELLALRIQIDEWLASHS